MRSIEAVEDELLDGGNTSGVVTRVGQTVRKPWTSNTARVIEFMSALRASGIDLPSTHGRDDQGRLVIDYVPGTMAIDMAPLPDEVIHDVGALIRSIHDASAPLGVPEDWPDGVLPAPVAN